MKTGTGMIVAIAATALLISTTHAQQYVYPAKGQTADQQKKDEAECGK